MQKLLTKAANHLQATDNVPPALVAKIRAYDAAHPMWACLATDETRDTWQALQGRGLV